MLVSIQAKVVQLGGMMSGQQEIDAEGMFVLPGGVDAHVHLTSPRKGPGADSWTDNFEIGSRAALAGGITTVGNMSFPREGETMSQGLDRDVADGRENSLVDFSITLSCWTPTRTRLKKFRVWLKEGTRV